MTAPTVGRVELDLLGVSCSSRTCVLLGAGVSHQYLGLAGRHGWTVRRIPKPAHARGFSADGVSCQARTTCSVLASNGAAGNRSVPIVERWTGSRWSVSTLPIEAGATQISIGGISCPAAQRCTAVGSYTDTDNHSVALAEVWLHGRWTQQVVPNPMVPVPTDEGDAVSCLSAAECVAVGGAEDAHGSTLAYTWNGSRWVAQPTPRLQTNSLQGLQDVSCLSATACTAVGSVFRTSNSPPVRPLIERWTGSAWQLDAAANASGAATSYLTGVACASITGCMAVGSYSTHASGANAAPLVERWDGSSWSIQTAPAPAGAASSNLGRISCTSPSACTAVGTYQDFADHTYPLAESWDGTAWTIENVPSPSGATNTRLYGVSCSSAASCTAVGAAASTGHSDTALIESWDGSSWKLESVPLPSGSTESNLLAISCASTTACTAVGNYWKPVQSPLVERWNGSTWTVDPGPRGPVGSGMYGVSCTADGSCTVVGSYFTMYPGGVDQPALWSAQSSGP